MNFKVLLICLGLIFSIGLSANEYRPPRGVSILSEAGHCFVGAFGSDGDVGVYKGHCKDLSRKEICTAYLVGIALDSIVDIDPAKVSYCKSVLVQ